MAISLSTELLIAAVIALGGYVLYLKNSQATGQSASRNSRKKAKNKKKGKDNGNSITAGEAKKDDTVIGKQPIRAEAVQQKEKKKAPATVDTPATRTDDDDAGFPTLQDSARSNSSAPRPLAERKAKKTRKTVVDDMLDADVEQPKTFSRTMRIVPPKDERRATLLNEPEDSVEQEQDQAGAWQSVASSSTVKKPPTIRIGSTSSSFSSSSASSTPARSVPGLTEVSKRQRQNAAKAAAVKAAKEAAEQERLAKLAAHKRTLERERMKEQDKQRSKLSGQQIRSYTKKETLSGGMQAKVMDGQLIWE